jgi:hypothetical protein
MSLNPNFSASSSAAAFAAPDAKLSFNINAFNGNTTNFGKCAAPAPAPKSMTLTPTPTQPRIEPFLPNTNRRPGMIMPM